MKDQNHSIKIIKENLVYENEYGKLFDDDVTFLPQSINGTYVRWTWKTPYSVAILPMLNDNEALLINNFRHSARKAVIEVPKGFGEKEKEPILIAKNELEQETGLHSNNIEQLGSIITDPAFSYHPMYLFIAHNCESGESHQESSEVIIENIKINIHNAQELFTNHTIEDAVTLFLLLWEGK